MASDEELDPKDSLRSSILNFLKIRRIQVESEGARLRINRRGLQRSGTVIVRARTREV